MNQSALYDLSYGVYLCTTWDEGKPVGCVANSTMQVTSEPATVAVSINKKNYTHACIEKTGYFAITILAEHSDPKLIGRFGFNSARQIDKFEGVNYAVRGKLPVPEGGMAFISCKLVGKMDASTHTVFLGEVIEADELQKGTPMTYAYYHKVLKGKASENAPTYRGEEERKTESAESENARYVCDICGYEYDGEIPFEELPDDWVCPLCGMGKEHFQKR